MQAVGISLKEKLCYGIGAYGKDLVYAIVSTFIMVYYTDVVGVSPAFVGVIFLGARIWDAINDPIMGWIVDNTKTRWGKFRPWILGGTIVNSIVLVLLYLNPSTFLQGTLVNIWCAVTYILWGMTYTLMDVPYWAMIPSFSSDSQVRDQMASVPRLFANLGQQTIVSLWIIFNCFFRCKFRMQQKVMVILDLHLLWLFYLIFVNLFVWQMLRNMLLLKIKKK